MQYQHTEKLQVHPIQCCLQLIALLRYSLLIFYVHFGERFKHKRHVQTVYINSLHHAAAVVRRVHFQTRDVGEKAR